jgi:hypothetical protein
MSNYLNHGLHQYFQKSLYQEKVAKDQRDMEYLAELERKAEKRTQEQMTNQAKVDEYVQMLDDNIAALRPQDAERLKSVEQQARQSVIQGVAAAQGDYKAFMLRGGQGVLRDYKKSVMESQTYQQGLANKENYELIKQDMKDGKSFHDVNAVLKDGSVRQVDIRTAIDMFENGEITELDYKGSEEPVDVKPMDFYKTPHPLHPYQSSPVTYEEMVEHLIGKGQSEDIARRRAASMVKYEKDGVAYTDFDWGVKDNDWSGNSRKWGANSKNRAGAAVFAPTLQSITSFEPTRKEISYDWTSADGERKKTIRLDYYNVGNDVTDGIKRHLGLIKGSNGEFTGQINNQIGFFNMENGRSIDIKGQNYDLVSTGNEVQVIRDTNGNVEEMYMPVTIRVSEDFMEENMGEGAWWNGWTMESKEFGGVTKDVNVNGQDMREIQVSVNIPLDPMNIEQMNTLIGRKTNQVVGGVDYEDYVGAEISAGGRQKTPPSPDSYRRVNGQVFSTKQEFGKGSQADRYTKQYQTALKRMQNSPKFKDYSSQELAKFADMWAKKNM